MLKQAQLNRRRAVHKAGLAALLGLLLSPLLTACADSPTFMRPASLVAGQEYQLFQIVMFMSIGVFLLVEGVLVYNIFRFRRRQTDDDGEPEQLYGNHPLQLAWTVIPVLLVALLYLLTILTMEAVAAPSPARGDLNVKVIGHRWWFEYQYPDLGIVTANELHVPVNRPVKFLLTSADVIHSFWVPQLSGKIDLIPGQTNTLWFQANDVGDYHGHCSEYCGLNHANMRIKVVVQYPDQFDAWVKNQQQPPPQPQTDLQQQGYDMITGGICNNCHTLGNNQAVQPIAPNLTHLFSRSVFAGATYPLNQGTLRQWLEDNQAMKPYNLMSDIQSLPPDTIDALMAYLTTLR